MSESFKFKEIFILLIILILTFILYITGFRQLEPYLDHLSILIVIEIFALFLLISYEKYFKYKNPKWVWNIMKKSKDIIQHKKLSEAIVSGNGKKYDILLMKRAVDKLESDNEEEQLIGNQEIYELSRKNFRSKKYRILWVDDDAEIIFGLVEPLVDKGYLIDRALNKKEAEQLMDQKKYDIIILDIILPSGEKVKSTEYSFNIKEYNGLKFLKSLPDDSPPILVLSVVNNEEMLTEIRNYPQVKKYIEKGCIEPDQLRDEILKIIEK